ncbi:hypothetical protein CEXT_541651 [Caerostris extrusa]|uniref:Uncharacterized protein n=1 Tax=Caerostris extrusa TaxID=172846 RepID=A0AAV4QZZ0_CAEEX|nr:hypothetical protein CEXT_541651 [Caerostris extrusa]
MFGQDADLVRGPWGLQKRSTKLLRAIESCMDIFMSTRPDKSGYCPPHINSNLRGVSLPQWQISPCESRIKFKSQSLGKKAS